MCMCAVACGIVNGWMSAGGKRYHQEEEKRGRKGGNRRGIDNTIDNMIKVHYDIDRNAVYLSLSRILDTTRSRQDQGTSTRKDRSGGGGEMSTL